MQVSRDYALSELKGVRDTLNEWIETLEDPKYIDDAGEEKSAYDSIPSGRSVADLEAIPAEQLKAELMAIAGRLESLAVT